MTRPPKDGPVEIKCPSCGSEAIYRYGHTSREKQRYLCLICNKQFTLGNKRATMDRKPLCPICGRHMHIYRRESVFWRFRCSGYPFCRTYIKIKGGEI
jgi:transposase-like protein